MEEKGGRWDDAIWILTCAFIIMTMQSGFALLESGSIGERSQVNVLMKNTIDICFGGLTYWLFGYALSFGLDWTNGFVHGSTDLLAVTAHSVEPMGELYANFVFQFSFATVSGAMAERTRFSTYVLFSTFNTFVYVIPAGWLWGEYGFLRCLGVVDIAGSGAVHLVGGVSGLVATLMLGPRRHRFGANARKTPPSSYANTLLGLFLLWWAWLAFNCGSSVGVSGDKWRYAARSAINTIQASVGGGCASALYSIVESGGGCRVAHIVNGVLGSLVGITAVCAVTTPLMALGIGAVSALLVIRADALTEAMEIDDPVSVWPVHGVGGIVGMLAVGFCKRPDRDDEAPDVDYAHGRAGLFFGGGVNQLGVQALACVALIVWTALTSYIIMAGIKYFIGLRLSDQEEELGADASEHFVGYEEIDDIAHVRSLVKPKTDVEAIESSKTIAIEVQRRKSESVSGNTASRAQIPLRNMH